MVEITQDRIIHFKDGMSEDSWVKWFRHKHPLLVMRVPQGLDNKRAKQLNPKNVARFYINLEVLYQEHNCPLGCIWDVDESGCQGSQNDLGKVFAKRGVRGIHKIIPTEREWLSVLTTINANGTTIPNYYIFKGIRKSKDYTLFCEERAMLGMQKKEARWTLSILWNG